MATTHGHAPADTSLVTDGAPAAPGRDVRIDALRGVAIALIVVQHLGWAYLVYRPGLNLFPSFVGTWADLARLGPFWYNLLAYTSPFCVAVFAFVAGYLLVPALSRPVAAFMAGRFRGLMVPFLAWVTVYALFPPADRFFLGRPSVLGFVWDSIKSPTGGVAGPVWFLQVLFVSSLLTYAVARLPETDVVLALSGVAALLLPRALGYLGIPALFGAAEIGVIHPYVVAGVLARRRGYSWPRPRLAGLLVATAAFFVAYRLRSLIVGRFAELPTGWAGAFAVFLRDDAVTFIVSALGILMCIVAISHVASRYLGVPGYVGRYSLGIMGAQLPVIALLVSLDVRSPWIVFPVTMAASLGVSWLLDRNRLTRAAFLGGRGALPGVTAQESADVVESHGAQRDMDRKKETT